MHRVAAALLAPALLSAAPERDWYRVCRNDRLGVTVYMDLRSIEGTGTRAVADELVVLDTADNRTKAIRIHVDFDCAAHTLRALTNSYLESDGDAIETVPADESAFQPADKNEISGRTLAFACDPESSDAPPVEDPLHDEHAGEAPTVD